MSESSRPDHWTVTVIYEGGPRDGDREAPVLRNNPLTLIVLDMAAAGKGDQWEYTLGKRQLDPAARCAVLTLQRGLIQDETLRTLAAAYFRICQSIPPAPRPPAPRACDASARSFERARELPR
jgi:hypothetical protein